MDTIELSDKAYVSSSGTLHELYSGAIFVGQSFLGEISYDSGRDDLRWERRSLAYFCEDCGEVWGRVVMQDSEGRPRHFVALRVACERHHDLWNVAGSLLIGHYEALLEDLPPDAVKRELLVHIAQAEKES